MEIRKILHKPASLLILSILIALLIAIIPIQCQTGTEVGGMLGENTTWTLENSPYSLTGNMLVDNGVTLTIDAGVIVNLNDYYIMVNGTLRAQGTEVDQIQFNNGDITFTQYSNSWNESLGSGCILENSVLSSTIGVQAPVKINNITSFICTTSSVNKTGIKTS